MRRFNSHIQVDNWK